ncbi:Leucine--tRNA ligase [Pseudomonas fluorescens]|nr:Leucine--tRNA ligase [Pseudomonas fluorescens]
MDIKRIRDFEKKWLTAWEDDACFEVQIDPARPKYYCLDMFPYPSGSGLHVGHPRGYIATDVYSRFKRMKGFNVLHPMGFDAFGLPAEQYAIETGQHPEVTTEKNISTFKQQLRALGLCYDSKREISTSTPEYYKWTQWIFTRLFDSWFCQNRKVARPIHDLITILEIHGNVGLCAHGHETAPRVEPGRWAMLCASEQAEVLMHYRLAYRADSYVNWCPALGTVLANDEVKDGCSERGGHPVVRKMLKQWMLRITAYADRLLDGLAPLDWPAPLKEMQRNWIGRSQGAHLRFASPLVTGRSISVFTTRPDTLFGVTFIALAPEHPDINALTEPALRVAMTEYVDAAGLRTSRDRMTIAQACSGQFTGNHAVHPLTGELLPIWVSDYILADYGTGAVMGVPALDERDRRFAQTFGLPVREVYSDDGESSLLDAQGASGLDRVRGTAWIMQALSAAGTGEPATNYRIRDAIFGRQRYWGEPIPIYYDEQGIARALPDERLALVLPRVEGFLPTEHGEPPLQRAEGWRYGEYRYETTTMPGWAGSSWYFLRYADPHNPDAPISPEAARYWRTVDLYVGGSEHATGHLLYARFWTHFLKDLGVVEFTEPFQRMLCQGMILGNSAIIYRDQRTHALVSADLAEGRHVQALHIDINLVNERNEVDVEGLRNWRSGYRLAEFEYSNGRFLCDRRIEKMSKSRHNVVNPNDLVEAYGADTFRVHELFLGPIEQSSVWSSQSIDGPHKFLQRVWRLFEHDSGWPQFSAAPPTPQELKVLHTAIAKVGQDTQMLSFNTAIAALMTCVNQLIQLDCHKPEILKPLLQLLHPFAPFMTQELWTTALGLEGGIVDSRYPVADESLLKEDQFECPVTINGKVRTRLLLDRTLSAQEIEQRVLADPDVHRWIDNLTVRKVIVVKERMVNVVVA